MVVASLVPAALAARALHDLGQSRWLDNITRELLSPFEKQGGKACNWE